MSSIKDVPDGSLPEVLLQGNRSSASGDQQDGAQYKATQQRTSHPHSLVDNSATLVQDESPPQLCRNEAQSLFDLKVQNYNYNKKRKKIKGNEYSQAHRTKRMKHSPDISKNHCKARITEWVDSLPDTSEEVPGFEDMSDGSSLKRSRDPGEDSVRSETTWDTKHIRNTINQLGRHGIVMQKTRKLCEEEKMTCESYLQGNLVPGVCLMYPHDVLPEVICDTGIRLESHVQRDILPWTVPSIYNLCKSKEWDIDLSPYEEQVDAVWTESRTMGSSQPKPDYVAGLSELAFDIEDLKEIRQLHTSATPIRISPGLLLPYLVCEAKSGTNGLVAAEFQNTHAGGILVRAMFELYKAAYQKFKPDVLLSLSEKIVVWTMDINHESVRIYGHYGVLDDAADTSLGNLQIYRHRIQDIRLEVENERFVPYNFVRNIYKDFIPIHTSRIRDALKQIRENRNSPSPSFGTSAISLTSGESPNTFTADGSVVTSLTGGPSKPLTNTAVLKQQLTIITKQLAMMIDENKAQREENDARLKKQKEEYEARLEQQKEENEARLEQYEARLEQQKEENKTQMASLREIIDLLKKGSGT